MSDRCTYFTKSAAERHTDWIIRKRAARRALIVVLLDTNHACVHPLNHNYVPDAEGDNVRELVMWAGYNGLLTAADRRTLDGY